MTKYRVNEMFYSLQGEGIHTGVAAVFLRMSGCNLRCPFCDTQHDTYRVMTAPEIVAEAIGYESRRIIITGGEPTLQLDAELTTALHEAGFTIHIETNGTQPLAPGVSVDWVTCSPKEGGEVRISPIDELKVVYWGQDLSPLQALTARHYALQPLDTGDAERNKHITSQTISYILKHPKWKLSLQTHKILNVR